MSQINHEELFDALIELRRHSPNWRLGQLISNVAGWADQNIWDIEDDQIRAAAEEHLLALAQQTQKAR
jgi:hypothetical protein